MTFYYVFLYNWFIILIFPRYYASNIYIKFCYFRLIKTPIRKKYNNRQLQDALIGFTLREFSWLLGYWSKKLEYPRSSRTRLYLHKFKILSSCRKYANLPFHCFDHIIPNFYCTSCNITIFNPTNIKETSKNKMKRFNVYFMSWWILPTLFSVYCFIYRLLFAEWNITKTWSVFFKFASN